MVRSGVLCALALIVVGVVASAQAETLSGPVVSISDGDTIEILIEHGGGKRPQRVRLGGIDAPESGQAFGTRAKQHLSRLIGGRHVTAEAHKRDRWGRVVATVYVDGTDVGLAMVEAGFAWWYRKYADEQPPSARRAYEAAETAARRARRGLWGDPDPMPPWAFRNQPPPPKGYAAACPCDSGERCTGQRGGQFCVRPSGSRRYYPRGE
jgi:micrococcal nuclease